jgi:hypothetical protein
LVVVWFAVDLKSTLTMTFSQMHAWLTYKTWLQVVHFTAPDLELILFLLILHRICVPWTYVQRPRKCSTSTKPVWNGQEPNWNATTIYRVTTWSGVSP